MNINYKNYSILQEQLTECITKSNLPQIQKEIDEMVLYCDLLLTGTEVCFRQNVKYSLEEWVLKSVDSLKDFVNTEKEHLINSVRFDLNQITSLLKDVLPQFSLYKISKILDGLHIEMKDLFISNMDKTSNELIEKYTTNYNEQLTFNFDNSSFNYITSTTPANMVSFYNSKMDVLASISNDGIFTFKADANDQNTKDFVKCLETLGIKIKGISLK